MIVILHSDDLGLSEDLTVGILQALDAGLIESVSVLANGAAVGLIEQRVGALAARPPRVAVHLNLLEGPSVADPTDVPWIVDEAGQLRLSFGRCLAGLLLCSPRVRRDRCRQIAIEWRAQIRKVKNLLGPIPVEGLDGHTHIHMLPFVFPITVALAKENDLGSVRVSREVLCWPIRASDWLRPRFWSGTVKNATLRLLALGRHAELDASGLSTSDAVTGVLYTGEMTRRAILAAIHVARRRGHQSLEVIMHVGPPRIPPFRPQAPSTARRLRGLELSGALQRTGY